MPSLKSLAKDTAVYGLSSIIGRFLNWLLVPLYTITFAEAQYGTVSFIYAWVALTLALLIYGMETGFFRFANHERYPDPRVVYSTAMTSIACSSALFVAMVMASMPWLSGAMHCQNHPEYVAMMAITVAVDAFTSIPFSWLRYRHRPIRFATVKLIGIGLNIGLNLFFILLCPILYRSWPDAVSTFYRPDFGIGYIFLSNLIATLATLLILIPDFTGFRWRFDRTLWREMLSYSAPLLVLGLAGIMNQNLDKILLPALIADPAEGMRQLGIYSANYKIAIVMVMFTQAFRFAYEPFIFAQNRADNNDPDKYRPFRVAMLYFVIFSMVIFLGVMFYLDILRYFIGREYFSGLKVVPIIMLAEFFFGVFFNLSLWYKLTDRTIWGTYFSLTGLAVTLLMNYLLVPSIGYMGCAWAALTCYGVMMILSYVTGRAKHPIGYRLGPLLMYFFLALALYGAATTLTTGNPWIDYTLRTALLLGYIAFAARRENCFGLRRRAAGTA